MADRIEEGLSPVFPISGLKADTLYARVCVTADVDGRSADEMLLMHLNQITRQYESNIVTFDTSNGRDYWRNAASQLSALRGFAVAYLGFGTVNPVQGAAMVMAEITVGIARLKPRLASGTSYTDTLKLEDRQHNQRYLSQIGGQCGNIVDPVTGVSFSTLNGTPFRISTIVAQAIA